LRHGFKASAERIAATIRTELGLEPRSPLCPWRLADHLRIVVFYPADLKVPANDLEQLTVADPDSWSGLTVKASGLTAVVLNPTHPKTRQRNTLMHEISHIHLGHVGNRVDVSDHGMLLVSDFSISQEEEANWLAGALLAPREALLSARMGGKSAQQICNEYGISHELCTWRLRMTGIDAQLQHRRRKEGRE
jgi:Zn-dependent peptidase ImmA (M78 family)